MFSSDVPSIGPAQVAGKVAEGWLLVDVRTDDEWADGRIPGSVHIPMHEVMQRIDEIDAPAVFICAVGARSARVTQFLNGQGREAVNLDGGVYAWADAGLPMER